MRLLEDFLAGSLQVRSELDDIFKALKNYQLRIVYPAKLPFKNMGGFKTFPDKHKSALQEIPKEVFQVETKGHQTLNQRHMKF